MASLWTREDIEEPELVFAARQALRRPHNPSRSRRRRSAHPTSSSHNNDEEEGQRVYRDRRPNRSKSAMSRKEARREQRIPVRGPPLINVRGSDLTREGSLGVNMAYSGPDGLVQGRAGFQARKLAVQHPSSQVRGKDVRAVRGPDASAAKASKPKPLRRVPPDAVSQPSLVITSRPRKAGRGREEQVLRQGRLPSRQGPRPLGGGALSGGRDPYRESAGNGQVFFGVNGVSVGNRASTRRHISVEIMDPERVGVGSEAAQAGRGVGRAKRGSVMHQNSQMYRKAGPQGHVLPSPYRDRERERERETKSLERVNSDPELIISHASSSGMKEGRGVDTHDTHTPTLASSSTLSLSHSMGAIPSTEEMRFSQLELLHPDKASKDSGRESGSGGSSVVMSTPVLGIKLAVLGSGLPKREGDRERERERGSSRVGHRPDWERERDEDRERGRLRSQQTRRRSNSVLAHRPTPSLSLSPSLHTPVVGLQKSASLSRLTVSGSLLRHEPLKGLV
ncbi:hypothetical protein KIPB_003983 [Kipferlia bialata]|uniref:Uncharacterized protein n=1 Tax=Kipferlia bialata TaxID=797122 RepID=A0A9K3GHR0_9EUKA|nr:hypothetical protein KIPB_003983 [Kipferlia bialata]|eukprot:g3983.t1